MTAPKTIGIAVVEYKDRYLVGIRGPDVPLAGFGEFPGGKCLASESPIACAIRECFEESGLLVVPEILLQQQEFDYPHGCVDLHFVLCHPENSADVRDHHNGFRWVSADELKTIAFPAANAQVVRMLTELPKSEGVNPCLSDSALPESD